MAKKKIDLSGLYTSKAQDTHNIDIKQAQDTKPHGKYAAYLEAEKEESHRTEKAKRINMAFSDTVYEKVQRDSEKYGTSIAYYINTVIRQTKKEQIDSYYANQLIRTSRSNVPRRKGKPAHRITLKFDPDVYAKIAFGAEQHNQTITQYVNLVIEANE